MGFTNGPIEFLETRTALLSFSSNFHAFFQGKEIILHYINELISDGVTYIPPFEESKGRPRALSVKEKRDSEAASDDEDSVDFALGEEASEQPKQHEKEDLVQDRLKGSVEPPPLQGMPTASFVLFC